jgi:hypothetical protein
MQDIFTSLPPEKFSRAIYGADSAAVAQPLSVKRLRRYGG